MGSIKSQVRRPARSVARYASGGIGAGGGGAPAIEPYLSITQADAATAIWASTIGNRSLAAIATTGAAGNGPTVSGGMVTFDGVNDMMIEVNDSIAAQTIPDSSGATAGKGFTCTGLAHDVDRGSLWFANTADNAGGAPSLVETSLDGSTQLSEILLKPIYPSIVGVQGITVDTSDDTLWFVSVGEGKIRHLTKAGVDIDFVDAGAGVNGVVYDESNDTLVAVFTNGVVKRYSASTLLLTETMTTLSSGNVDHLTIKDGVLYASEGASNAVGKVYRLYGTQWIIVQYCNGADAIEGIQYLDGELLVANDAYFHAGNPALNRLLTYSPAEAVVNSVDFVVVMRLVATNAALKAVVQFGNVLDSIGWALFVTANSSTSLRIMAHSDFGSGSAQRSVAVSDCPSLLTKCCVRGRIDLTTGFATFAFNGTVLTSSLSIAGTSPLPLMRPLTLGNGSNMELWDVVVWYNEDESAAIAREATLLATHGIS